MKFNYNTTFTKTSMCIIYILFVLGAIIGGALVITSAVWDTKLGYQIDTGMFMAYAAYLGTPTAVAIGFYAWKSKAENLLKIKAENEDKEHDAFVDTLANMGGNY